MRSFAILALAVASASASSLFSRQLPNCAGPCLANADKGSCAATDNACLCKNQAFVASSTTCIQNACQGSDLATALSTAQALCAAVGVTLSPSSTGGSAPAGTATTPAGSGTTTGSNTASTPTTPAQTTTTGAAPAATTRPSNGAVSNGVNALAGIAAVGIAALAL